MAACVIKVKAKMAPYDHHTQRTGRTLPHSAPAPPPYNNNTHTTGQGASHDALLQRPPHTSNNNNQSIK